MFGEIELEGIKKLKLTKNSIKLPEFTRAEVNERLYYFSLKDELRLYSEFNINILVETLLNNIRKEVSYKEYLRYQRMICAQLISEEKVTSAGQIKLPKKFIEKLLNPNVIFVGNKTHVKIFPSMEDYKKYNEKKHD